MSEERHTPMAVEPQSEATSHGRLPEASPPSDGPRGTGVLQVTRGGWGEWLRSQLLRAAMAFALGLAVGYILWGPDPLGSSTSATTPAPNPGAGAAPAGPNPANPSISRQPQAPPTRLEVSVDDDPARGPEDAPIVIIEFSDYECPFCKKWRVEVYDILFEQYGDVVRFVYRDFPIQSIHPEAVPAAVAANCAGEQGKYWEFHDLLFLGGRELGRDTYLAYAEQLGLDMEAFIPCLDSEEQRQEVLADFNDGVRLGVRGTPTFFINGIPVVGAQPFPVFQNIIEQELQRLAQEGG